MLNDSNSPFDHPPEWMARSTSGHRAGASPGAGVSHTLTTPSDVAHRQEQRRRRPLVEVVSLSVVLLALVLVPAGLIPRPDIVTLVAITLAMVSGLLAYIFSQTDAITAANCVLLGGVDSVRLAEDIGQQSAHNRQRDRHQCHDI